ncbi:hypothetical protein LZG75_04030 [Polynucleobacter sp. IMCC30063]|uniref:hypothetical protein n=1 Tax=unclassified Polynucleobacter TaxID=2640945 RepID=UPI001F44C363|nr:MULTISPECIES: hypothetical protein [unclassified Polynucleobacter]MCE7505402.1 hypothetical protein [Polynucleobacter sp. IMCC30063]MCE7527987.1 hypothetical protein [Polynucleobacter sp. IMCC 30228]MCE7530072.1 hypothetical protein [Polynucleobacter sp. IMCC 29146]
MSNTVLLIISIFVFCLLVTGLLLMVREFMGMMEEASPEVKHWLDTSNDKK